MLAVSARAGWGLLQGDERQGCDAEAEEGSMSVNAELVCWNRRMEEADRYTVG